MGFGDDDQNRASGIQDDAEYGHQHHAQGARAASGRRVEIIIGGDRRRKWSRELKAQITEESFAPGANVALTARRHAVSVGLLHYWRRCAREGAQDETLRFVPVLAGAPSEPNTAQPGSIEVELGGARIRLTGPVDQANLQAVLAAVRASA